MDNTIKITVEYPEGSSTCSIPYDATWMELLHQVAELVHVNTVGKWGYYIDLDLLGHHLDMSAQQQQVITLQERLHGKNSTV